MSFDLYTIDWTAIGSIVTFVAMLIAYWAIYVSDKQNKRNRQLQLLLMQREIEQKRLDELVENLMKMNDSMQPIVVVDYSMKLINGTFSEDDRHFIDQLAVQDQSDNNRLDIQLVKYDNNQSVKSVLMILRQMRQKYGEWVRDISILNLYKTNYINASPQLTNIISTMVKMSREIAPECEEDIHGVVGIKTNDLAKAITLMNIFCHVISNYLIAQKKIFEDELYAFVQKEQKRIDNMAFHDSIN